MQLVIIGNGFDISHGIKSQYTCFKSYLEREDPEEYDFLKILFKDRFSQDDFWWNFEENLGSANFTNLVQYLQPMVDSNQNVYEQEELSENLSIKLNAKILQLKKDFCQWINNAYEEQSDRLIKKEHLNTFFLNSIILNFNYTSTIEDLYKRECYHIHGYIKDIKISCDKDMKKIILGHTDPGFSFVLPSGKMVDSSGAYFISDSNVSIPAEDVILCCNGTYSNEKTIQIPLENANDTFSCQYTKKCKSIINHDLSGFFKRLKADSSHVDTIIVLGHSISEVDLEYYKKIVELIDCRIRPVKWIVSEHNGNRNEMKLRINSIVQTEDISFVDI